MNRVGQMFLSSLIFFFFFFFFLNKPSKHKNFVNFKLSFSLRFKNYFFRTLIAIRNKKNHGFILAESGSLDPPSMFHNNHRRSREVFR